MTDEQILKRLAEIEGVNWNPVMNRRAYLGDREQTGGRLVTYDWNPLDNPADAYALIEKHRLQIEPPSKFEEDCFSIRELWTVCAYDSNDGAKSEFLPHAICLAIIEANGGMGDE